MIVPGNVRILGTRSGLFLRNLVLTLICAAGLTQLSYAEGSADLFPSTSATGTRFWLYQNASPQEYAFIPDSGIAVQTPHYVYAEVGERINIGHSAYGFGSGDIVLIKPDGTVIYGASLTGVGTSAGRIATRAQELAGPNTITAGGYKPLTYTVAAGEAGVFMVIFVPEDITNNANDTDPGYDIIESANWDSTDQTAGPATSMILAWDVTVDDGAGNPELGRVFTYNMTWASRVHFCEPGSNPQVYCLTSDGVIYQNTFNDMNPGSAIFWASNKGPRNPDGSPQYKSISRDSCVDTTGPLGDIGCAYLYNPNELDIGTDKTHKLFYHLPDSLMPSSSITAHYSTSTNYDVSSTSLNGKSLASYWLYPSMAPLLDSFELINSPVCGNDSLLIIEFNSNVADQPFTLKFDVDSNGLYDDKRDVTIAGGTVVGTNQVWWDLRDGEGTLITLPTEVSFLFVSNVGEVHFPYYDVERNVGGLEINRLKPLVTTVPNFTLFWDDTDNPSSLTGYGYTGTNSTLDGTAGFSSSGGTHTFTCPWGDQKLVDQWTYSDTFSFGKTVLIRLCPPIDTFYDTMFINDTLGICVDTSEIPSIFTSLTTCSGGTATYEGGEVILGAAACLDFVPQWDYLGNDTFCVVVCDDLGTCDTSYYIITVVCNLQATAISSDPTICMGSDGYIRVFMDTTVAVADYTATLYPNGGAPVGYGPFSTDSFDLGGLSAGAYDSVVVVDANGCTVSIPGPWILNDPGSPIIDSVVFIPGTACGSCDGTMIIYMDTANLGTPPYEINYDSLNSGTAKFIGAIPDSLGVIIVDTTMCPGDYGNVLIIADAAGCSSGTPLGPYRLDNPGSCVDTIYDTIFVNTMLDTCVDTSELNGTTLMSMTCSGSATTAEGGTITFDGDSVYCVTYTPLTDYTGNDTACIIVCDENTTCDTTYIIITVIPRSDTCYDTTYINTPIVKCVDTTELTAPVSSTTDCGGMVSGTTLSGGTYTVDSAGCITFTPFTDYTGNDTICLVTCDTNGICDTSIIVITTIPDPDTLYDTTIMDTPIMVCTDTTELSAPITITRDCSTKSPVGGTTMHGTYLVMGVGCVTYYPSPGYVGNDTFCIEVCDTNGICDTTIIIITVLPPGDTCYDTTIINTPIVKCVDTTMLSAPVASTTDCAGMTSGTTLSGGTYTVDSAGCITFTPATDSTGNDTICIIVCDTNGLCDTTTIIITTIPDPDTLYDTTLINIPISVCVDTSELTAPVVSTTDCAGMMSGTSSAGGTYVIDSAGCVTYTPLLDYTGNDTFCIQVCDTNGICDTTIIIITVIPDRDTICDTTNRNTNLIVCVDTTELTGTVVSTTDCAGMTAGSSTNGIYTIDSASCLTYEPDSGFTGHDTICIVVCDTNGICDTTIICITVLPAIDTICDTTGRDTDLVVCVDTSELTAPVVSTTDCAGMASGTSANGSYVIDSASCLTYTPDSGFTGHDTLCIVVCGSDGICDTTIICVTVLPAIDTMCDTTRKNVSIAICVDTTELTAPLVSTTDCAGSDSTGTSIGGTYSIDSAGCVSYTPDSGYTGHDTLCIVVCGSDGICDTTHSLYYGSS